MRSWYVFFFQIPWLPEFLIKRNNLALLRRIYRKTSISRDAFPREDLDKYCEAVGRPNALTSMINWYRCVFRKFPSYNLKNWDIFKKPTLMLWGEKDLFLGKELTFGTEKFVEDLTLHYLPDCSHWTQKDQPEEVNRLMAEFLSSRK